MCMNAVSPSPSVPPISPGRGPIPDKVSEVASPILRVPPNTPTGFVGTFKLDEVALPK